VAEWLRTPQPPPAELLRFSEEGVGLVPLGAVDERTSDLLGSERFAELVSYLKARFDYILIDTAPTPADPAALTLSRSFDRTLAVVELGTSLLPQVHAAAKSFGEYGSGLIGAVVVTAPSRKERRRQRRRELTPEGSPRSLVLSP
jgi:receptor protein-tyrosine kinase